MYACVANNGVCTRTFIIATAKILFHKFPLKFDAQMSWRVNTCACISAVRRCVINSRARVCRTPVRVDTSDMLCCKLCTKYIKCKYEARTTSMTHMRIHVQTETSVCALKFAIVARWLEISSLSILTYFKSDEILYLFANRNE